MIASFQKFVRYADAAVARMYLSRFSESDTLSCFLFHSVFRDESEIARNMVDPLDRTTVDHLRRFIEYYLEHGYRFVSARDVPDGLPQSGRRAMITFDDGYFSNWMVLPVLQEYGVPATFFIAGDHVRDGQCFWWDVLYREWTKRGATPARIHRETIALKSLTARQINDKLRDAFGERAFRPICDIDRPLTPAELREMSQHPLVEIGNHTAGHAILTNYAPEEVVRQIADAQDWLAQITGTAPTAFAYPNGAVNQEIARIARSIGLRVGFTTRPHKNPLGARLASADLMQLGRFCLRGDSSVIEQCRTCRSDLQMYSRLRRCYITLVPGGGRA